jgi:hypothetical protein
MKSKGLLYLIMALAMLPLASWILSPGGSPGGKTGSPGDGGATCIQCHTGSNQPVAGWITSDIPASGYVPGQTYTITATGTHSGVQRFGFEVTAEDNNNGKKGTLVITNAAQTKLVNGGKSVTHTSGGTTPSGNSKAWTFDWTAPAAGAGTITFYGAFNAANGNGSTSGDVVYTTATAFNEFTTGIADENLAGNNFSVYPNPFSSFLTVSVADNEGLTGIRITSSNGAQVYSANEVNRGINRISTESLAPGMYHITVMAKDGTSATKMLIRK